MNYKKNSTRCFFQGQNSYGGPLFRDFNIFKSFVKAAHGNWNFIKKSLKVLLPSVFNSWFKFSFESHCQDTRWANLGWFQISFQQSQTYGRYPVITNAVDVSNQLQSCHQNLFYHLKPSKLKELLTDLWHVYTKCHLIKLTLD